MSFLGKGQKADLLKLAEELGIDVTPEDKIVKIKSLIVRSPDYEEDFVRNLLESVVEARKSESEARKAEIEAQKREEDHRSKLEEAEIEMRIQKEIHDFELERLRLSNVREGNNSGNSRQQNSNSARELHNFMQKYNPEVSDISLYLVMFERQARKAEVEERDWVSHLMGLLPLDIVQIILREPEEKSDDYN